MVASLCLAVACSPGPAETTGTPAPGGKPLGGPPALEVGTAGDAGFAAMADGTSMTLMDPGDGGWQLAVDLRARGVDPRGATVVFRLLDTGSLAPILVAPVVRPGFRVAGASCEATGVPLRVDDPTLVQGRACWLGAELLDVDGRGASARVRVVVLGGPDAGTPVDGGSVDASVDGGGPP